MRWICLIGVLALIFSLSAPADAGAIRGDAGFNTNTLARNDDYYTGLVPIGFTADFYSVTGFNQVYVNNNGNITFTGGLYTYTPYSLLSTTMPMIAPFFADVDTRYAGEPVRYGTSTVDGHAAFGVNWIDVDYYYSSATHTNRNDFQLVLIDRSDIAAGDFDIEFNYDRIQWESGEASNGDVNGLGGYSARVGYSDGVSDSLELPGSAINGAFLDSGPAATALIHNSLNSQVDGRYIFRVRGGTVDPVVPEPSTIALLGLGLGVTGIITIRRRRRS